jgi:pyruvate dehydrogenase E1 component alpha subunit
MLFEQFDPLKGQRLQILDEDGRVASGLEPRLADSDLLRMYELMVLTRAADDKAVKLQRQGRLGTYGPSLGHEACQVGTAYPIRPEDYIFPYFRDLGLYLARGYPLADFYLYWMGNEEGLRTPEGLNIFSLAIPVASQIPHAVGAGLAVNVRKTKAAVVCTFGDGATSEGDFHEGLNFAGVFKTPNVFVCYNNQWAISTPIRKQTASATIAQKAVAYGFPGMVVDGNDVLAVYAAVGEALDRARSGGGPSLIEAFTYRLSFHTTSDDATRYRTEAELKEWQARDPIRRFQTYLKNKGLWTESLEKDVQERVGAEVEKAVAAAESVPLPRPEAVFAHVFKDKPPRLESELAEVRDNLKEGGR